MGGRTGGTIAAEQVIHTAKQLFNNFNPARHDPEALLHPEAAARLRRLLVARGVLVVKRIDLADEQQVRLAALMGSVRDEGVDGIFKVTIDPKWGIHYYGSTVAVILSFADENLPQAPSVSEVQRRLDV